MSRSRIVMAVTGLLVLGLFYMGFHSREKIPIPDPLSARQPQLASPSEDPMIMPRHGIDNVTVHEAQLASQDEDHPILAKHQVDGVSARKPVLANLRAEPQMPLVVVDEHMHVLPHWFGIPGVSSEDFTRVTVPCLIRLFLGTR